jgi:predicted transcriptional regulator of viral defense system
MIIDPIKMVRQLYVALSAVFLTNKRTSTVHLTSNLHKQWHGSLDISQYCDRIKTIANALRDVDQLASDDTLVTVLTRRLHNDINDGKNSPV